MLLSQDFFRSSISRRQWLKTTSLSATLAPSILLLSNNQQAAANQKTAQLALSAGTFSLPKLPYAEDALEPYIDAKTMNIHHTKHHQAYIDNLNKLIAGTGMEKESVENILKNLEKLPANVRTGIRNNAGGHYNHTLFWQMMTPKPTELKGELLTAINETFKSLENLLKSMKSAAMTRFGSGWAWLVYQKGKLAVASSPNQDNSIMDASGFPLLGVDVWEHAYYLKYQNRRADYVDAWTKIINWEFAASRFNEAKKL